MCPAATPQERPGGQHRPPHRRDGARVSKARPEPAPHPPHSDGRMQRDGAAGAGIRRGLQPARPAARFRVSIGRAGKPRSSRATTSRVQSTATRWGPGQPHRRTGGRPRPERRPSQGTAKPPAPNPGGSDWTDPHAQAGRPRAADAHRYCRRPPPNWGSSEATSPADSQDEPLLNRRRPQSKFTGRQPQRSLRGGYDRTRQYFSVRPVPVVARLSIDSDGQYFLNTRSSLNAARGRQTGGRERVLMCRAGGDADLPQASRRLNQPTRPKPIAPSTIAPGAGTTDGGTTTFHSSAPGRSVRNTTQGTASTSHNPISWSASQVRR